MTSATAQPPLQLVLFVDGFRKAFTITDRTRIIRLGRAAAESDYDITIPDSAQNDVDGVHVELHPLSAQTAATPESNTPLYLLVVRGRWPVSVTRAARTAQSDSASAWSQLVTPLSTMPIAVGDRFVLGKCKIEIAYEVVTQAVQPAVSTVAAAAIPAEETSFVDADRIAKDKRLTYSDVVPNWLKCTATTERLLETDRPLEVLVTICNLSEEHDMTYFVSARLQGIDEACSLDSIRVNRQPRLLTPGGGDTDQIVLTLRHLCRACQPAGSHMLSIYVECLRDNAPVGKIDLPIDIEPYESLDIRL